MNVLLEANWNRGRWNSGRQDNNVSELLHAEPDGVKTSQELRTSLDRHCDKQIMSNSTKEVAKFKREHYKNCLG